MNAKRTASLKWLDGLEPQTYSLDASEETIIGRDPTCNIALNSAKYGGVSRRHAMIRYRSESLSFEISDLGSSNGTYVNRQRLSDAHLLKSGDRIQLGSHGVEFSFEDPSLPATVVQPDANQPPVTVPDIQNTANNNVDSSVDSNVDSNVNSNVDNSDSEAFSSPSATAAPTSPTPSRTRNNSLVRTGLLLGGGLVVALLLLSQGRIQQIWEQRQSSPDRSSAITTQTYTDPNGRFQIDLPSNYAIETRTNGINLASADGSFQGAITVIEVPRPITAAEMVQEFAEQQSSNPNLQEFTMQNTTEVEGGVRIDWIARLGSANAEIDAVTHFVQQDNLVIEVDLFSVDRSFTQQDATEANLILRSLRIGQ